MRVSAIVMVTALLPLAATRAPAQTIDVVKLSCKQFLIGDIVRQDYLALWLSGYYNGTRNDPIIENRTVQNVANKVSNYCHANLDATLMDAVQNTLDIKK
jgi:acid stress chaperone HdeB